MLDQRIDVALLTYGVLVGLGLLNCFFGYRLFRVLLGIWGFLAGVAIAATLLQGTGLDPVVKLGAAALGGIAGAALVSVLYVVGVFLFGASFGLLASSVVLEHVRGVPSLPLIVIVGVLGGAAALLLQKPLIALFTAFGGAWVMVACIVALAAGCPLETFPARCVRSSPWALVLLGVWLLLGLLGFATQTRSARRRQQSHEEP